MKFNDTFIDFLRYSLSDTNVLPSGIDNIDWKVYLEFCAQQGIIGVIFRGIERSEPKMQQATLFEWIGQSESIKAQNMLTNKRMLTVNDYFRKRGYRSCILKGQANGLMYPQPEMRSPGDIDIWVEGEREGIIKLVLSETPDAHYSIHHVKMPVFKDVSVEVHYRPMYLTNWFTDKKLQRYIESIQERQFSNCKSLESGEIGVLTDEFNALYQILHMHAHFFSTRNNLKQLIDYYYLLRSRELRDTVKAEIAGRLKDFGVLKYAKGIMWIMKEVLGLEERLLIVEKDEKIGRLIFGEVLKYGTYTNDSPKALTRQFWANMKLAKVFPQDVLINPFFLVWHQWWKLRMTLALKRD